jgi:predicted Na+-dependent transporter
VVNPSPSRAARANVFLCLRFCLCVHTLVGCVLVPLLLWFYFRISQPANAPGPAQALASPAWLTAVMYSLLIADARADCLAQLEEARLRTEQKEKEVNL